MPAEDWAGRYEVALDTRLELLNSGHGLVLGIREWPEDQILIWFEGRRFVWHSGTERFHPVLSVMVRDASNYRAEHLAVERLLSALTYRTGVPIHSLNGGVAFAQRDEFDVTVTRQPRAQRVGMSLMPEIVVADDDDLRRCLALNREALVATTGAMRFLSFWKAIETAVGATAFAEWMRGNATDLAQKQGRPDRDWFAYLNDLRNATAHAVLHTGFYIDPDDPATRDDLASANGLLSLLVKRAIEGRWPDAVIETDPPDEMRGRGAEWLRMLHDEQAGDA